MSQEHVERRQSPRKDLFNKVVLTMAVGFLGLLALRPLTIGTTAEAQATVRNLYIEPGTVSIRTPDGGGVIGDGKVVIDLRTGDVWGFPTNWMGAPYPIDPANNKPATSNPIYLGRFNFAQMKTP